jgi:hypothetical protein
LFEFVYVIRGTASLPETLQHEPRRVLTDPDLLGKLKAADALPRGHQQVHSVDPFMQWDVAAPEDRSRPNREIDQAGIAAVEAILPRGNALRCGAAGTLGAFGPEPIFEVQPRSLFVREQLEQLVVR